MSGSSREAPHFYFDENARKWASMEHSTLPRVLVLSWHADPRSMMEQLLSNVRSLPATFIPVPGDRVAGIMDDLKSKKFVACILFLSHAALADESLFEFVQICGKLVLDRPEFRLFVQLADGLVFDELKAKAKDKAYGDRNSAFVLTDSVHFSHLHADDFAHTARLLQSHLLDLPRIRHRLAREWWESGWIKVSSIVVGSLRWLFLITAVGLVILGAYLKSDPWGQWGYLGAGQLVYVSLVALLTLGTRITSGSFFRWILLLGPLMLVLTLLSTAVKIQWPFFLAGILTAVLLDVCVRSVARWKRRYLDVVEPPDRDPCEALCPGRRSFGFLAKGPWIPPRIRVFISYSEQSDEHWGRRIAEDLKNELSRLNIEYFFAPDSIEPGSSWRHRLTFELYTASIFVQFLDDKSAASRPDCTHWPALELGTVSAHQAICGLPAILVVCHPSMMPDTIPDGTHRYIRQVLSGSEGADESSLWVLNYEEGMARKFAQELSRKYRRQAVSILPIKMAAILEFLLMLPASLLCGIGVFGSIGIWLVLAAATVMRIRGADPAEWLLFKGYVPGALIVSAFWLGFVLRLAVSAGLELWHQLAGNNFKWRVIEVAALSGLCLRLGILMHGIVLIYASLSVAFGVLLGSYYLRLTMKGSFNMKPALERKAWIKS
jgi:hypothetical protein